MKNNDTCYEMNLIANKTPFHSKIIQIQLSVECNK
jgi:hypothetical protein